MKLKLIALAVMMAAGSAHAAIDQGNVSGNGSLVANLKFNESPVVGTNDSVMATFDLGLTMDQFSVLGNVASVQLQWNLATGIFSSNQAGLNAVPGLSAVLNYGTKFNDFNTSTNLDLSKAQLAVYAFDGQGTEPGAVNLSNAHRLFTTGNFVNTTGTAVSQVANSGPSNGDMLGVAGSTTVTSWITGVNTQNSHNSDANGANVAATGAAAYLASDSFGKTTMFDTNGLYAGTYAAGAGMLSGQARALTMHQVYTSSATGSHESTVKNFGVDLDLDGNIEFDNNGATTGGANEYGLWTLQGDVLTYYTPPVPEPETYALMLAGLGLVGVMAKRRKAR